jgi:hypothetical protein
VVWLIKTKEPRLLAAQICPIFAYYCTKMKPKEEGSRIAIITEVSVHLNTSTEAKKNCLGVCIVENFGPRGSKHKVLKIESNRSSMRGRRDCQESRRMQTCTTVRRYIV